MSRLPRLTLPGVVHHLMLVGHNRLPIVHDDVDRQQVRDLLRELSVREQVAVHAYVVLENRVRVLCTPRTQEGVPDLMQSFGRRYAQFFNRRHRRTGTLWEGRYRSTLLEAEHYLLYCMVDMDSDPVRSGLVQTPQRYPWSSHAHYVGWQAEPWLLTPPPVWALGNTPFARELAYAHRVQEGVPLQIQQALHDAIWHGWPLGDAEFLEALAQKTGRRLQRRPAGRPALAGSTTRID